MTRTQNHYCEIDGDGYELSRLHTVGGGPFYRVRHLLHGGSTAEIVSASRQDWRIRFDDGRVHDKKHRPLCHAVCSLRDMGLIGKYR